MQSLHLLRMRWCSQMLPPPQSLHRLRMRRCSQKGPGGRSGRLLPGDDLGCRPVELNAFGRHALLAIALRLLLDGREPGAGLVADVDATDVGLLTRWAMVLSRSRSPWRAVSCVACSCPPPLHARGTRAAGRSEAHVRRVVLSLATSNGTTGASRPPGVRAIFVRYRR